MTDESIDQLQDLILRTSPQEFEANQQAWKEELVAAYGSAEASRQQEIAELLAANAVDMRSVLPEWSLKGRFGSTGEVTDETLTGLAEENLAQLQAWGRADLVTQAESETQSFGTSNLVKLTKMSLRGEANTYWGNDYAANLRSAMRRGACLVTTNPVLVNIARQEDPDYWTPVRDRLQTENPNFSAPELAYAMTIQVVVANAKLLRPLWELTDQRIGYVSLQLSPEQATDAEQMISEAKWVYERLEQELGGTPNTVFKVPGTKAGIDVAGELTSCAMGVNITVNFSLPQQIAFAGIIEKNSTAPVSFRTQMDGRLDDPIGDELHAAGVSDWEQVKTWATTLIRQREYRLLCKEPQAGGLGFKRAFPLPASGRGPWNILRSIHNEPEVPIFITIFPNRQEEFDAEPREIDPHGMWAEAPSGTLEKLWKSKLFRQAYQPDGMTVDEFDDFLPGVRTLTQFCESYQDFLAWVAG